MDFIFLNQKCYFQKQKTMDVLQAGCDSLELY